MTKKDQAWIVREIMHAARKEILARVKLMPKEWDGLELRQYCGDFLQNNFIVKLDKRRAKAYKNTVSITGGL